MQLVICNNNLDGADSFRASPLNIDWGIDIDDESVVGDEKVTDEMALLAENAPTHDDTSALDKSMGSMERKRPLPKVGIAPLRRKKRNPGLPKRPLSAYNLFFAHIRPKIIEEREKGEDGSTSPSSEKLSFEDLGRLIGKRWKALSDADRRSFEERAEKDSIRYRKEMEDYNTRKKQKKLDELAKKLEEDPLLGKAGAASALAPLPLRKEESEGPPPIASFPVTPSPVKARLPGSASPQPPTVIPGSPGPQDNLVVPKTAFRPASGQTTWTPATQKPSRPSSYGPVPIISPATSFAGPSAPSPPEISPGIQSHLPVPPGMQMYLPDPTGRERKYTVKYKFYSMTKREAEEYMQSLEASARVPDASPMPSGVHAPNLSSPPRGNPGPLPPPPQRHMSTPTPTHPGAPMAPGNPVPR